MEDSLTSLNGMPELMNMDETMLFKPDEDY